MGEGEKNGAGEGRAMKKIEARWDEFGAGSRGRGAERVEMVDDEGR